MPYPLSTFGRRLRALRNARGLSQVELARRIGRHQTTIGPYERDEYAPAMDVVERLADVLDTSPEYLVFGRASSRSDIAIVGRLRGSALLYEAREEETEQISILNTSIVGYRLEDDCMLPAYRPGQIVLALASSSEDLMSLLGADVIAELEDGRALLRRLMPGPSGSRFDLAAYNAPPMHSIAVAAARRVVGAVDPRILTYDPASDSPRA